MHAVPPFGALDLVFGATILARPFLMLLALVLPAVAAWTFARGGARDGLYLAAFAASMALVLMSTSVAAFLFSWELMALLSALLIGSAHASSSVRRALFSYTVVGQLGALCIAGAFAILAVHGASTHFENLIAAATTLPAGARAWAFALALIGFGSKAGLAPLHFWLPRAHPAAPANVSALLSGVMLAVALYGLMLSAFALAAPLTPLFGFILIAVGVLSAIVGALYAALDSDVKRLLAYSSIENTGISVTALGVAILAQLDDAPSLAALAIVAALFVALNHGLFKSLLFLGAGTIVQTAGTSDLEALGGLFRALRFTTPAIFLACMAASALPPTNGFASEWLVFSALMHAVAGGHFSVLLRSGAALALTGLGFASGFAALAFAKFFGVGFLGRARAVQQPAPVESIDASFFGFVWLGALIATIGLVPLLALKPLADVASAIALAQPETYAPLPTLPALVAMLPFVGGALAIAYARLRKVREVPTWTCGSEVTVRAQYTAGAFSNPLRRIVARVIPRSSERTVGVMVQRIARKTRIVQSGLLRVYVAYAVCAVILVLALAR